MKIFSRKRPKLKQVNYGTLFGEKKFVKGYQMIKDREFSDVEVRILLSMLGVGLHRGDMKEFEAFLDEKKKAFGEMNKEDKVQ